MDDTNRHRLKAQDLTRRSFLRMGALGAATLKVSPHLRAQLTPPPELTQAIDSIEPYLTPEQIH
jgi:hypothetical protein